jgi:hypothetical protein
MRKRTLFNLQRFCYLNTVEVFPTYYVGLTFLVTRRKQPLELNEKKLNGRVQADCYAAFLLEDFFS